MTSETLKNPSVVLLPNAIGLDKSIESIQKLLGTLPWLEKAFGRAWTIPRTVAAAGRDEVRQEPMVYQGGKEYYPVLPNDALKSYCFFRVNKARPIQEYEPSANYGTFFFNDTVDLIFWFNMRDIDNTKDYVIKEELLRDVLNKIESNPDVTVKTVWDDKVEDIFSGYTLYPSHRDLLMYPFGAFRIELNLQYSFSC